MWPPIYEFFYDIFYKVAKGFGFDEEQANFVAKATIMLVVFVVCIHVVFFMLSDIW